MKEGTTLYLVYEYPERRSRKFVAVRKVYRCGKMAIDELWECVKEDYGDIERIMRLKQLVKVERKMGDEPRLKETWI